MLTHDRQVQSANRLFSFIGGDHGPWRIAATSAIRGETLPAASHLRVEPGDAPQSGGAWVLRGLTSNERYVTRLEKDRLAAVQEPLGRPDATQAVLIPISKSGEWWALTQDERRRVFEETSNHIQIGMEYLPAVARRLHHCRDLGTAEPYDFLTWFEFSPADAAAFNDLLRRLRATPEWNFVIRETEIRLERA